jgi:glycosyltransferase involved in cell wall biosynthesis
MNVSVIIPAYNEEKLIGRCLKSIIETRLPPDMQRELIVINNASTDQTKEIAQSFLGVRVVDEPQKGLTKARQAGLKASCHELLIYFDADTVIPQNWFFELVDIYRKNPELVGASGPYYYENLNCVERFVYYDAFNVFFGWLPWQKGFLLGGNFSVKRWVLEKIGGFDTSIAFYGEDSNLTRRVIAHGPIKVTKKLAVVTSPRRFKAQGTFKTFLIYVVSFLSEFVLRRPMTTKHKDIR